MAETQLQLAASFPDENPEAILRIDRKGTILYANRSSHSLLKLWHSAVSKKAPDDILLIVNNCLNTLNIKRHEVNIGRQIVVLNFTPVPKQSYVNIYGQDITASKATESQLMQAQKMEAIAHLTSGIAHDFNNILQIILGYAQLSMSKFATDPDTKLAGYLNEILHAGERGRDLIAGILAFGRAHPASHQSTDGNLLIIEVVKLIRSTLPSSLNIDIKTTEETDNLCIDSSQLHQVLTNLIINAYHASGERGTILLHLHKPQTIEIKCSSCQQTLSGNFIELSIHDNGKGMSPEQLVRIFDPFYTTKKIGKGSGMGLSMVHEIMHKCDGHIIVETTPNVGTCFRLFLRPTPSKPAAITSNQDSTSNEKITANHIMVIDDEMGITGFLSELLRNIGFEVSAFNDPVLALERFISHPEQIDLVITDYTMPNMTGAALAKKLLNSRPDLPIILCTGDFEQINETSAKEIGIAECLKKPVDSGLLLQMITALLSD